MAPTKPSTLLMVDLFESLIGLTGAEASKKIAAAFGETDDSFDCDRPFDISELPMGTGKIEKDNGF